MRVIRDPFLIGMLVYFILLAGCARDKKKSLPQGITGKEEMAAIIRDLNLAQAAVALRGSSPDSAALFTASYYKAVFESHGTTPEHFMESVRYYSKHPGQLDKIYEEVLNDLSRKQAESINK